MYKYKKDEDKQLQRQNYQSQTNEEWLELALALRCQNIKLREQRGTKRLRSNKHIGSTLSASDNIEIGREMLRMGKEENVLKLNDLLNKEPRLRSRIKRETNYRNNSREHSSDNNATAVD